MGVNLSRLLGPDRGVRFQQPYDPTTCSAVYERHLTRYYRDRHEYPLVEIYVAFYTRILMLPVIQQRMFLLAEDTFAAR